LKSATEIIKILREEMFSAALEVRNSKTTKIAEVTGPKMETIRYRSKEIGKVRLSKN
jgi:hypothetical protein